MATETVPLADLRGKPRAKRNTLTRRTVLAAAGAAVPLAPLAAAPVSRFDEVTADAELFSAFGRWIAQERAIAVMPPTADDDEVAAALGVTDAIMMEIAALPTRSVTGLAVKVYLESHARHGGSGRNIFKVALPEEPDEGDRTVCNTLQRSLFADAMSWLPVLNRA